VTDRKAKAKCQKKGSRMCLKKGQLRAVHRRCDLEQHRRQFGTLHLDTRQGRDRRKARMTYVSLFETPRQLRPPMHSAPTPASTR
jgi:hypothetical protein